MSAAPASKRSLSELFGAKKRRKSAVRAATPVASLAERASSESRNERSVRDRTLSHGATSSQSRANAVTNSQVSVASESASMMARLARSSSISETATSDAANGIVRSEISELAPEEHTATSMTRSSAVRSHPTPPAELSVAEPRLTPTARIAQIHSLLRDPQLPNQQRISLLTQLGEARRNAMVGTNAAGQTQSSVAFVPRTPAAPPRPPTPSSAVAARPPAHAPPRVSPERCPVCRESFRIYHESQNIERAQAASRANDTGDTERARSAVLSNGETIADQYKKIFRFEELMSGMMNDREIIHNMVVLHRALIEKPSQKLSLPYQVWTHEMLAEHFDVANEHIFDPVRETQRDLRMTRKLSSEIERSCLVPDPDNPARRVVDAKAVGALEKILKEKRSSIQALEKSMQKRRDTAGLQAAMMQLVGVIGGLSQRDTLRINPRIAAGTMERGGDALRTAGKTTSEIGGTQADLYALSGFQ